MYKILYILLKKFKSHILKTQSTSTYTSLVMCVPIFSTISSHMFFLEYDVLYFIEQSFSRIRSLIFHIKKIRRVIQYHKVYSSTHPTRCIVKRLTTHPLQTSWWKWLALPNILLRVVKRWSMELLDHVADQDTNVAQLRLQGNPDTVRPLFSLEELTSRYDHPLDLGKTPTRLYPPDHTLRHGDPCHDQQPTPVAHHIAPDSKCHIGLSLGSLDNDFNKRTMMWRHRSFPCPVDGA
jgi:hypothetical protein